MSGGRHGGVESLRSDGGGLGIVVEKRGRRGKSIEKHLNGEGTKKTDTKYKRES